MHKTEMLFHAAKHLREAALTLEHLIEETPEKDCDNVRVFDTAVLNMSNIIFPLGCRDETRGYLQDLYDAGKKWARADFEAQRMAAELEAKFASHRTKEPDLVVTRDGVPFPDQAEGIRLFKEACTQKSSVGRHTELVRERVARHERDMEHG